MYRLNLGSALTNPIYQGNSVQTSNPIPMKFTAVGNVIRHSGSRAGISRIRWDNAGCDPANPEEPGEDVTKTSIQLGFTYNFDLPGYTITRMIDP